MQFQQLFISFNLFTSYVLEKSLLLFVIFNRFEAHTQKDNFVDNSNALCLEMKIRQSTYLQDNYFELREIFYLTLIGLHLQV